MNEQKRTIGRTPAIVLENPKFPRNVGFVLRSAFNFQFEQLYITGNRVGLQGTDSYRLPREERFKEYSRVDLINDDRPLDYFPHSTPVIGIELVPGAMPLTYFEHPEEAVYVFGPEDGGISKGLRTRVHQFLFIPTLSCLNLSMAVTAVLYDRMYKAQMAGTKPVLPMEEQLSRYQYAHEQQEIDVFDPV